MKQKFANWRRQRIASKVIRNGKALDRCYRLRAGLDRDIWPDQAALLDDEIRWRERQRDRLLKTLKESHQHVLA